MYEISYFTPSGSTLMVVNLILNEHFVVQHEILHKNEGFMYNGKSRPKTIRNCLQLFKESSSVRNIFAVLHHMEVAMPYCKNEA